jgi:hypothetical protein
MFPEGAVTKVAALFCCLGTSISRFAIRKPPIGRLTFPAVNPRGFRQIIYSSPEALAAAPCSRAGQTDSYSQNLHAKPGFAGNSPARISAAAS